MKILKYVLLVIISVVVATIVIAKKIAPFEKDFVIKEVSYNAAGTARAFNALSQNIEKQLASFGRIVSDDMDFAMKLSIDGDISAPEISEFALQYIEPMGFSFLEIVDSAFVILSSGHFPSSNGNVAMDHKDIPENKALIISKDLKGETHTALLVKVPFNCAGTKLFAVGGISLNDELLSTLSSNSNTKVLVKVEETIVGFEVKTISELKDHKIIINDKTYYASSTSLNMPNNPEVITIREEPADITLFDLLR